jgi:hypothetical protein
MAMKDGLNLVAVALHVGVAIVFGGIFSYFTDVKWLAASLLVSAAMFLNGSLGFWEDARPDGFENPNGTDTPDFARPPGAMKYWISSLAVTAALVTAGIVAQIVPWS